MNEPIWWVRPPQLGDVTPLAAIATAVSAPISLPQLTHAVQQANGRFWMIAQQQQPIGFATLLPIPGLPQQFELAGGVAPKFQRQGAGSFLWQVIKKEVAGTAVRQISHMVSDLNSPTARFLQRRQFTLEHEERTMALDTLPVAPTVPSPADCQLQRIDLQTAVRTLPALYQRCFANTPWLQPYTAAEISDTWQSDDQLYYLVEDSRSIGFVWLHFPKLGQADVEPVGIVPERRGMRYGRFLLTSALNNLSTQQIQSVNLGVWADNHNAIHLYQTMGFRHVSSSFSLAYAIPQT